MIVNLAGHNCRGTVRRARMYADRDGSMTEKVPNINIIRTKLHRPPLTKDFVPRPHLLQELEKHRQRPLTMVSAPAGYGKSTLVSSWADFLHQAMALPVDAQIWMPRSPRY